VRALFGNSVWVKRLLLFAILTPLSLLGGELFTRILLPQNVDPKMNIFRADPVVGYIYEPYAEKREKGREYNVLYQINSIGLRDREYSGKEKGLVRVLLLGDSFSVSHGLAIEESLSRQLEGALQAIAGSDKIRAKIEVVNAAAGGYSPYNYWKAYRRWADVFNPDVVVVGLSPDDHDCDNEYLSYYIEEGETLAVYQDGKGSRKLWGNDLLRLRKWLSWNSEMYILLRNFLYYNDIVGTVSLWLDTHQDIHYGQLEPYLVPQTEKMSKAWEKTLSYLRSLHDETAADGVVLVVLPIPLKLEISSQEFERELKAGGRTPEEMDIDQPLNGISAFCSAEAIAVLDPRPALRKRHAEMPCYFVYDGHWNAEGIRSAAAHLAEQWRNLGLPPWQNTSRQKQGRDAPTR